ncbi:rab11 family-interacting protein 5 [Neopelma chrysocephalum]|uniref:rab11 family-interacting protein 5 n=1 Tax=Neopelma chrysocephalum TaxID=114329 RepID=UPI000FCD1B43|nr:rab11 family-interacting protein 5 [Neopelma chrysocephalum]
MALLRAAALPAEGGPAWLPTHVQVTVVRARGLRCKGGTGAGKGKAGGSDAYTVIQLGREKYSTSVAEKSGGSPEWREECAFELPPEPGPRAGLVLTVMHRALVGMDRFLGQAVVPLEPARQRGREPDERWHKLHSKAGKKEKERGEILVSIQFTRNNLTASMFDLSMKDKPRSPFGKLKDKVTGKKKYDLESASAIIPSSLGGLDVEDDYEMGGKKAKVKGFFLKNKLRKSSLTQSNTSLGSDSTISSASLSLAANVPEVTKSPNRHSSLSMERSVTRAENVFGHCIAWTEAFVVCVVCAHSSVTALTRRTVLSSLHSLEVSPQVETSSDAPSHFPPCSPAPFPPAHLARMPSSNLPPATGDSQAGCLSPTNPFLNSLQSNPFFEDLLADQVLNSPSPTHFFSSFPCGPHASPEVAGSFYSSEDCSPSASLRHTDPERESPAKSIGVPVPETTPPSQGDLPPPDTKPAVPPPLSEWDDTFDAFATSRLKPEGKKENFFASLAAEGMAFIDDADAASPTERAAKPAHEKGTQGFEKADSQMGGEIPAALRSWTNFSSLDVGANLVSTTQEATVIEDVLSPVSAGSMGRRRKSSTPMVWTAAFASGNSAEKEASTALTAGSSTREGGDGDEEESSSAGTNGWMTIATETAPEPSESTQSVAEERVGQDSVFGPRPAFLGDGAFEANSASRAAARVLPRSTFPPELAPETLPGSNVVAVPPRVLAEVAARPLPAPPEQGTELQGAGNEEDAFDIRTSVYRLQASMRLEASESLVKLSSDIRERHVVLSPWTGTQEREEIVAGSAVPPPKPPRWFAAAGVGGDGEEEEARGPQQGSEERGEDTERPKADVELPRSRVSSEPSVPASPSPPALGVDIAEAGREFLVSKGAECADSAARASELGKGDTSLGEDPSEMNETDVAEQFETCASKFSLDGSGQSGAEQSWSQPRLSPQTGPTDNAKWEMASAQEPFPEELNVSGLNPPSKLGLSQPEMFWTALEEQEEAAAHPAGLSPRLARGESPPRPQPAWDDGEGQEGHRPEPCAPMAVASPPEEAEQGRPPRSEPEGPWHSADSRIDFKKADFWKPDRAEERPKQEAPSPKNPFTLALSPNSPSNPFVETPPDPPLLPAQAALPEKLDQGDFSFAGLHEEALGQGFLPANPTAGHPLVQPPFPHASQPLAFSTPFLVAATNPEQFGFPSPAVFPASLRGVPAASSRAAAQPCPLPQPGDTQASALVVLPRETQPAEKPLFQQTTSPHPVKPISAAVQEVSAERKQQHRSSLTSALSNGLEKLRTVTTSSVQPVAPTSHPEKTDSKKLKDPTVPDQSAKYYHLTHDELIQLLLQREMELSKKEEHIHELENYIDQLLVRIMEQSPTLLQIPLGEGNTK